MGIENPPKQKISHWDDETNWGALSHKNFSSKDQ